MVYDINGNPLIGDDSTEGLDDLLSDRLLVWHDEFKKPEIDETKWMHVYSKDYAKDLRLVTETGDGLTYRTIKDYRPESGQAYSSPELMTNGLFEFKYGRIEAKIKFPSNSPYHSTFWTLGANFERLSVQEGVAFDQTKGVLFPSCGEIDIAENDNTTVGARTHWASNGFDTDATSMTGGNINSLTTTPTDWHIYSCEWTDSSITFYVDGTQKGTWSTSNATVNGWNPFNHPHFIILNCIPALNGTPTWDVANTLVKWVRVYAPVGVTQKIVETSISIPSTASITVGERHWLGTPTFTPSDPSDMTVKWLSHNENIVTCYGGMLIGVSSGTTYVQATSKHGFVSLCKVTVS